MGLVGWLIAVAAGVVVGLVASLVRRPHGVVINLLMAVVGAGIGAWLATVFGTPIESRLTLGAIAAGGAVALTALSWMLRRG